VKERVAASIESASNGRLDAEDLPAKPGDEPVAQSSDAIARARYRASIAAG